MVESKACRFTTGNFWSTFPAFSCRDRRNFRWRGSIVTPRCVSRRCRDTGLERTTGRALTFSVFGPVPQNSTWEIGVGGDYQALDVTPDPNANPAGTRVSIPPRRQPGVYGVRISVNGIPGPTTHLPCGAGAAEADPSSRSTDRLLDRPLGRSTDRAHHYSRHR
jgi:hypothetical protein